MSPQGRVAAGYFSLSGHHPSGDDRGYLAWHQLDHMPEQYGLAGMVLGQRWASTPECRAARAAAAADGWSEGAHLVVYLLGEPLEPTIDGFLALGARLREEGRFGHSLPSCYRGPLLLDAVRAAPRVPVSAAVVPFRPHLGVYLIVEEEPGPATGGGDDVLDPLVAVEGVVGAWTFTTAGTVRRPLYSDGGRRMTLCYLDDEPAAVAARLAPVVSARAGEGAPPLLAAPFESVVRWDWERFGPGHGG